MRYRVRATIRGKRKTTDKYWNKKRLAQKYADATNDNHFHANARVVKDNKDKVKIRTHFKYTYGTT